MHEQVVRAERMQRGTPKLEIEQPDVQVHKKSKLHVLISSDGIKRILLRFSTRTPQIYTPDHSL